MARIVKMCVLTAERHLYWRGDRSRFVTVCGDGSVILDGMAMTLEEATSRLLKTSGIPSSAFWEQ